MMALTLALVGEVVPKAQAGSAMGLLGTLSAVGTALGPSLGGVLLATWGWQAVFWVNVPLGLAALALAWWQLPAERTSAPRTVRFDHLGTALLALSLTAYALALTLQPGAWGRLNTGLLLAAGLGLAAFAWVETRAPAPLLRLQTLRQPAVAMGVAVNALITTVVMATLVVGPFYLAGGLGLDAARMGLVMTTGPAVAALVGAPAGQLVDRLGATRVTWLGLLLMLAGSAALPWASAAWGGVGYAATLALITAGYASTQAANNTAVMASAPADQRGLVSGLVNLSRNLGLITGASAMGAVYQWGATATTEAGGLDALAGLRLAFAAAAGLVLMALAVAWVGARLRS
jgi:MFS family permease